MNLLLVAHGTRKARGVALIGDLAQRVGAIMGSPVHVAFVDVLGPTPTEVLSSSPMTGPAIVVPAFLSRGYHVSTDLPSHVIASGHRDVTVTEPLGPSPQIVRVLAARLAESGWRRDDSVILAAAGTSDPTARYDLHITATWLSAITGARVELAFCGQIDEAVSKYRHHGGRVVVASYLLSEGLFQDRLHASGADVVTAPLGTHPGTVREIANRFRRARVPVAA